MFPHEITADRRRVLLGAGLAGAAAVIGAGSRPAAARAAGFTHPGMLHTSADLTRVTSQLSQKDSVVTAGWQRLIANGRSHSTWKPRPLASVIRGGTGENYAQFYLDVHAAYQNALRWRLSGDTANADAARDILNAWSQSLTEVNGNADRFLAAGIYGYQFANAAELMRGYDGFDLARAQTLLTKVFYPLNDNFLNNHNDACITNYWANWDLCTVASVMAIGILCDDATLFDRAVAYFKDGPGNGAIRNAVPFLHDGGLGQWQESGRDQGHSVMGIGLMGTICEMAWNQGVDLYGYDDNRFLKGAEYVARYNLGRDVPFTPYQYRNGTGCVLQVQTVVAEGGRGQARPVWELVYNHYVQRRGLSAPNVSDMAASLRAEGGGGDYGSASGGFDALGFGTLLYTRDRTATTSAAATTSSPATSAPASGSFPPRGAAVPSRRPSGGVSSQPGTAPTTGTTRTFDLAAEHAGPGGLAGLAGAAVAAAAGGIFLLRSRRTRAGEPRHTRSRRD